MKAIVFDAFGTLFKVTIGGSARTIMNNITDDGAVIDEKEFFDEWKAFNKKHTTDNCGFMTERCIFISRIQMFYNRYSVSRSAENDADLLLVGASECEAYPETNAVLDKLMKNYQVFIGSNYEINGKKYIVHSHFVGNKDIDKVLSDIAVRACSEVLYNADDDKNTDVSVTENIA